MPKDCSCLVDAPDYRSPVGGLSDALYTEMVRACERESWTASPIGGMSLPEFLRLSERATGSL
jgi:hypothetical protein